MLVNDVEVVWERVAEVEACDVLADDVEVCEDDAELDDASDAVTAVLVTDVEVDGFPVLAIESELLSVLRVVTFPTYVPNCIDTAHDEANCTSTL